MIRNHLIVAGAMLGAAFSASSAQAQSSSLFGGRGVQSSGTMSNGVSGSGSGGSNSSGSNAYGNSGSLTGFTGQSVSSASGFASGAQAGGALAGQSKGTFAGNRNAANAATQNGQMNQNGATAGRGGAAGGRGGASSLGGMSRSGGQRNRGNTNGGGGGGNSSPQSIAIRPMQRIAFDYVPRNLGNVETSLGSQVAAMSAQGKLMGNVAVRAGEDGTVILSGQVGSESERRKAELAAKLEPGVRSVVNELTVAPAP